ncbi:MAG: flagellar basal body rod protein FlgB [Actinomycetota bacterium]|nr:flagellar basal body rod protein FlgB [Actinomycetota bacterium]
MEGRPHPPAFMNLFDTTQIGLERAISGASLRQSVLAGNIANANTPGYARRDVDFHGALRTAMANGERDLGKVQFAPRVDSGAVLRADGNGVDVDVESANLAKNGLEYQSLVAVARGRIDIIRAAMGVS